MQKFIDLGCDIKYDLKDYEEAKDLEKVKNMDNNYYYDEEAYKIVKDIEKQLKE